MTEQRMMTPNERYLHDPRFKRLVDMFEAVLREHGQGQVRDALMVAEERASYARRDIE